MLTPTHLSVLQSLPVSSRQTSAVQRGRRGQGSLQDDPNHRPVSGSSRGLHYRCAGSHVLLQEETQRQETAEGPGWRGAGDGVSERYR